MDKHALNTLVLQAVDYDEQYLPGLVTLIYIFG